MANIEKRGNRVRIVVSDGLDVNGKQIKRYLTYTPKETAPKKREKEILAVAVEFERQVKSGKYYDGNKMSFIEFSAVWEKEWAVYNITESVKLSYIAILKRHIFPEIGALKISKISTLHCQKIVNKLNESGKTPATVKRVFAAMNSVFRYAYKMRIIEENPCDRCTLPKMQHDSDLHYWELEQAKRFLAFLDQPYPVEYGKRKRTDKTGNQYDVTGYTSDHRTPLQFKVFYTLAIYGGFRCGELLALRWNDVYFDERTISINKAVAHLPHEQKIKAPKTPAAIRDIVLPEVCFDLLKLWREEQQRLSISLSNVWKGYKGKEYDHNYIFIQNDGSMMSLWTPGKKFSQIINHYNESIESLALKAKDKKDQDAIKEMKLPMIRLHDLRHTSATLLLGNNVDIETVSRRLGHAKASITLDVYGHAMKSKDKTASDKLDSLFNSPVTASDNRSEEKRYS